MKQSPFPPLPPLIERLKTDLVLWRKAKKDVEENIKKNLAQLDYEEREDGEDVIPIREAISQLLYDLTHTERVISALKREIRRLQRSGI